MGGRRLKEVRANFFNRVKLRYITLRASWRRVGSHLGGETLKRDKAGLRGEEEERSGLGG